MALNFPGSPTSNQIYVDPNGVAWQWDATVGVWNAVSGSPSTLPVYTAVGTDPNFEVTTSPLREPRDGEQFRIEFPAGNDAATIANPTSLNMNTVGAKLIHSPAGRGIPAFGITANMVYTLTFDAGRDSFILPNYNKVGPATRLYTLANNVWTKPIGLARVVVTCVGGGGGGGGAPLTGPNQASAGSGGGGGGMATDAFQQTLLTNSVNVTVAQSVPGGLATGTPGSTGENSDFGGLLSGNGGVGGSTADAADDMFWGIGGAGGQFIGATNGNRGSPGDGGQRIGVSIGVASARALGGKGGTGGTGGGGAGQARAIGAASVAGNAGRVYGGGGGGAAVGSTTLAGAAGANGGAGAVGIVIVEEYYI